MNGGNKQRKLGEDLHIPAAYLLIGLHLLKNFAQLRSIKEIFSTDLFGAEEERTWQGHNSAACVWLN